MPVRFDDVARQAAELVLGARCPGCGEPGPGACPDCLAVVAGETPRLVTELGPGLPPVAAGGAYAERLRRVLLAAKERSALGLLPLLGGRLAAAVALLALELDLGGPLVLVPVPSAPAQVAERGVDFTAALARVAAGRLRSAGLPARSVRGLRLLRRPRDQSGLDRRERLANLAGAFRVAGPEPAGRVVVVDDIVTTGATLAEAVRACAAAGRPPVAAATVAMTIRRIDTARGAR